MATQQTQAQIISDAPASRVYSAGTLRYTRHALIALTFWLLWGDFCYILMETVVPSILPLKLESLGASNTAVGLILTTIPMAMPTVLNPIISYKSDRYRSRWGRRIPFILFTLPPLVICLMSLGFGQELGYIARQHFASLWRWSPNTVAIVVIALLMSVFSVFNSFVNATFWYLFNDVVPVEFLARFMSWFRTVSLLATSCYSFFIFRYASTHSHAIYIGVGVLYFVGLGLMCLNVREGQYPSPPQKMPGSSAVSAAIRSYFVECMSMRHYWYLFAATICMSIGAGTNAFLIFFYQATGLSLKQIGVIAGTTNILMSALVLLTGALADRYHPIRIILIGFTIQLFLVVPANAIWLIWHPGSANAAYWMWMIYSVVLVAPTAAMVSVGDPPLLMRIFPRERYGQFCSANALWRSLGFIVGGLLAGIFLDLIHRSGFKMSVYFFIPVWQFIWYIPALWFLFRLYKSWQRHGGDNAYVPPLPILDGLPLQASTVHL